ncbi:cell division protein FtsJ [Bifidobacterium sp. DSM 109958]|uniref:Cell division protein FtsJ n=1 Tax=Bifidobacterium moraviense TaxID=2675323 RepID=A0A7Y0F0Z1_9BIFI|nr:TlyA family RNA methyltransferase [Bifidobacterium sp. DSM 109958]NMM99868.1 cell division protein FtsJ [Bifidobacterium sp. DSM 109958]
MSGGHGGDRLDARLVAQGLVDTRTKAQRLIREGRVLVDGTPVTKPSATPAPDAVLGVDKGDDYVSRGAYKLVGALDAFGPLGLPDPRGRRCLDIGASTGGFTDVLLRRGAGHVVALDVGHDQLDARIRRDPRVTDMSGVNIRDVEPDDLPYAPDYVVSDVSFISLTYVMAPIARLAAPGAQIVLLVKPQFEVGRAKLGRHGIVERESYRLEALDAVVASARDHGLTVRAHAPSPITGTHGNVEYLLWLTR